MAPSHRALVLTPVSPHMLFDRSLVLDPASIVEVTVAAATGRAGALGRRPASSGALAVGDTVDADRGRRRRPASSRFGGRDFHQILKAKFGLNDR